VGANRCRQIVCQPNHSTRNFRFPGRRPVSAPAHRGRDARQAGARTHRRCPWPWSTAIAGSAPARAAHSGGTGRASPDVSGWRSQGSRPTRICAALAKSGSGCKPGTCSSRSPAPFSKLPALVRPRLEVAAAVVAVGRRPEHRQGARLRRAAVALAAFRAAFGTLAVAFLRLALERPQRDPESATVASVGNVHRRILQLVSVAAAVMPANGSCCLQILRHASTTEGS
jgi:hypothetical protein